MILCDIRVLDFVCALQALTFGCVIQVMGPYIAATVPERINFETMTEAIISMAQIAMGSGFAPIYARARLAFPATFLGKPRPQNRIPNRRSSTLTTQDPPLALDPKA